MNEFQREIIPFENYFWDFYNQLDLKIQEKFDWTISLIERTRIVPKQYFDHMTGTDGLWEIRIKAGNGIYRVFCFFDHGNVVLLLNGFQKKTQKTPRKEIMKAEMLKKKYYESK